MPHLVSSSRVPSLIRALEVKLRPSTFRNIYLYATSTRRAAIFPRCSALQSKAVGAVGTASCLTHGRSLGLEMAKLFPRVAQPAPSPETHTLLHATAPGGRAAAPARCHQVCWFAPQGKGEAQIQGGTAPASPPGGMRDLTCDRHHSDITGAETCILTPIRSQLIS